MLRLVSLLPLRVSPIMNIRKLNVHNVSIIALYCVISDLLLTLKLLLSFRLDPLRLLCGQDGVLIQSMRIPLGRATVLFQGILSIFDPREALEVLH